MIGKDGEMERIMGGLKGVMVKGVVRGVNRGEGKNVGVRIMVEEVGRV